MSAFRITDGPYAGDYDIDPEDFTGSEVNRFRQAVGVSMTEGLSGTSIDLDSICGLVWLIRSRTSKGLAYAAVADNVTRRAFQPIDEKVEGDPLDPTSSAAG